MYYILLIKNYYYNKIFKYECASYHHIYFKYIGEIDELYMQQQKNTYYFLLYIISFVLFYFLNK